MKLVEPKVELLGYTQLDLEALDAYLADIGATEFEYDAPTGGEGLIEVAGRQCYRSWQPGLNANVTRVRKGNSVYIDNVHAIGHGSVIEHGCVTFVFWNVSRVFTHELVRHRIGTAMSQESLRYVRLTDLSFWFPTDLQVRDRECYLCPDCYTVIGPTDSKNISAYHCGKCGTSAEISNALVTTGIELMKKTVEECERVQLGLAGIYDIDELKDFSAKKKLTSGFRRVAPIGLATGIVWSMNYRAARHLIQIRTSRHAEEEIRIVFDKVAQMLVDKYENMFGDLTRREVDGVGEWTTPYTAMPYDNEKVKTLAAGLADAYGIGLTTKNHDLVTGTLAALSAVGFTVAPTGKGKFKPVPLHLQARA